MKLLNRVDGEITYVIELTQSEFLYLKALAGNTGSQAIDRLATNYPSLVGLYDRMGTVDSERRFAVTGSVPTNVILS